MKERIDITVPDAVLAANAEKRERINRTERGEPTDRVPVVVDCPVWTSLTARGGTIGELLATPRDHLRGLILNHKWRCENIPDDKPIETDGLVVEQDFGALRGVEFPMQVVFQKDQPPKTLHLLHAAEEIDRLAIPDPESGFNRLRIEWYHAMTALVDDFDVRLNGNRLPVQVTINHAGGPIPSAFALCGSNLFLWIATDPERIHHLMDIVTESHTRCIRRIDEIKGSGSDHAVWLGADTAEMMGPAKFKEFVVPYYVRLWDRFSPERPFHMCGKINHLLDLIRTDLKITYMDGFGFPTDRHLLSDKLAGHAVLRGGPHPALIHDGPIDRIVQECSDYIRTAGSRGRYILSEGFGLVAGTPPEHIEAMVQASKLIGQSNATMPSKELQ